MSGRLRSISSYTDVTAPFDGIVTARQVSIGQLVGASSPTTLATIVQLDPIWVNFTVSERDVLQVRATLASRGETTAATARTAGRGRLQTESGYPHHGKLDYIGAEHRSLDRNAGGARQSGQ